MFKVAPLSDTYAWPVTVNVPGVGAQTFTGEFARLPQSEIDTLRAQVAAGEIDDKAAVARVFVGWGDNVVDEAGQKLAFNVENRDRLLDISPTRVSVYRAWLESLSGLREKN